MRAVFVGASSLAQATVRLLLQRNHEVLIIDRDKAKIDALSDAFDCGFLLGDGSKPALLREADPDKSDFLFCLTGDDKTNILASLAGRSLGYKRVVPKIEDPEFEHLCIELALDDLIIPARTIGVYLADMFEGRNHMEIVPLIKDEARMFSFVVREEDEGPIGRLDLPADSRVMFFYRKGKFTLPDEGQKLERDDEVMIVTHSRNIEALHARWTG